MTHAIFIDDIHGRGTRCGSAAIGLPAWWGPRGRAQLHQGAATPAEVEQAENRWTSFLPIGGYAEQASKAEHVLDLGFFDACTLEPIWSATTDSTMTPTA